MLPDPHGGILTSLSHSESEEEIKEKEVLSLPALFLDERTSADLEMISCGAYSPLKGFLGEEDYSCVLGDMRLKNGFIWSLPITLAVPKEAKGLVGKKVALKNKGGDILGLLHVQEVYSYDKKKEASLVYKTNDEKHPGVALLYAQDDYLVSGPVMNSWPSTADLPFREFRKIPEETRTIFKKKGWKTIVGFQTRNPIHRAHEYIQKCALEIADGLFIHPLVGFTKSDDIPAEVRMKCYRVLLENYYPEERCFLSVFPAPMRYAGPREALFHAIVRKNYGCTHMIIGRDHAGVGNYYGPFDAHKIFEEFGHDELGVTPLFFDFTFYCQKCANMASPKSCPHPASDHLELSGTRVREMLRQGKSLPPEFTRKEVTEILMQYYGQDQ